MAKPLNERIATARTNDRVTITDLRALIAELTEERDRQLARQAQADRDSVDIALSDEDRDEAAAVAGRSARLADAYTSALEELEAKLERKLDSEAQRAKQAERDAILVERDALAERWQETYPRVVAELVDLFAATIANEERMKAAHIYEASAEAVGRGLQGNFQGSGGYVERITKLKLPALDGRRAWPPEFNSAGYAEHIHRALAASSTPQSNAEYLPKRARRDAPAVESAE